MISDEVKQVEVSKRLPPGSHLGRGICGTRSKSARKLAKLAGFG
jgi:hypothetical protein